MNGIEPGTVTSGNGIIDSPRQVGGWPEVKSAIAPPDTESDGMPDEWERRHGFNPADSSDGAADADQDGYTNLDEFLNVANPRGECGTKPATAGVWSPVDGLSLSVPGR